MAKITLNQFSSNKEAVSFYLRSVDEEIESARAEFITKGEGQAMAYEEKYKEAIIGGGPILQAEADALGLTLDQVVASVLVARSKWRLITEKTEPMRVRCKRDMRAATRASDMMALIDQLKEELRLTLDQISK